MTTINTTINLPRPTKTKHVTVVYAQEIEASDISDKEIVIFLAGPTPQYGGSDPAKESWRDTIAIDLDEIIRLEVSDSESSESKRPNNRILLICPEPFTRNWADTHHGLADGQIMWEHKWMERANILLFWHETRWTPNQQTLKNCYHGPDRANIGIQFRFEVGLFISRQDKMRIFYIPDHAEGVAGPLWWLKHKKDRLLTSATNYDELLGKIVAGLRFVCN